MTSVVVSIQPGERSAPDTQSTPAPPSAEAVQVTVRGEWQWIESPLARSCLVPLTWISTVPESTNAKTSSPVSGNGNVERCARRLPGVDDLDSRPGADEPHGAGLWPDSTVCDLRARRGAQDLGEREVERMREPGEDGQRRQRGALLDRGRVADRDPGGGRHVGEREAQLAPAFPKTSAEQVAEVDVLLDPPVVLTIGRGHTIAGVRIQSASTGSSETTSAAWPCCEE